MAALVLVASLFVGGSCGREGASGSATDVHRDRRDKSVRECDAVEGSVTDVKSEPEWRPHADYRPWTDREGCLLRIDVLAERPGPTHCGWEDASVIVAGRPIGARYSDQRDVAEYVKDPKNVFGQPELAAAFEPDAVLPPAATDTGFRRADASLWHVPGDQSAVWVVTPSGTERWPAGTPPGCM